MVYLLLLFSFNKLDSQNKVKRSKVFLKKGILKLKDWKNNADKWLESGYVCGDTIEKTGILREFSLSQFTYQTIDQYDVVLKSEPRNFGDFDRWGRRDDNLLTARRSRADLAILMGVRRECSECIEQRKLRGWGLIGENSPCFTLDGKLVGWRRSVAYLGFIVGVRRKRSERIEHRAYAWIGFNWRKRFKQAIGNLTTIF